MTKRMNKEQREEVAEIEALAEFLIKYKDTAPIKEMMRALECIEWVDEETGERVK